MLPTKVRFIFARHFRGEDFYQIQQKQELPLAGMFVNRLGHNQ
jgi:hypothetical protein